MTYYGRPAFEVVAGADATARRLISVDTIREIAGIASTVSDEALGRLIDAALTQCARSCRLATYRASPPTLAQEAVRATWLPSCWPWWAPGACYYYAGSYAQPSTLLLPWRAPITEITVAEGETELVENTDYRLLGAGVVERISGCWATGGNIVVDYTAGFVPLSDDPSYDYDGEPLPADLISLIADQVRSANDRAGSDLNLRSEDIPGIWSGSYNVPGGDAMDASGLLRPLFDALSPYRAPPSIA